MIDSRRDSTLDCPSCRLCIRDFQEILIILKLLLLSLCDVDCSNPLLLSVFV